MSLRIAVAYPFRKEGGDRVSESEFVVALSLDRDWFSPDQAKRLVDVAASRGLVTREDGDLAATFDPADVAVPENFTPDEAVLRQQSTFERVLDDVLADGVAKQDAVADINELQRRMGVTVEAAAVAYARRRGLDVVEAASRARGELGE